MASLHIGLHSSSFLPDHPPHRHATATPPAPAPRGRTPTAGPACRLCGRLGGGSQHTQSYTHSRRVVARAAGAAAVGSRA
nr:unnamed protein product [Digitaria exilis]